MRGVLELVQWTNSALNGRRHSVDGRLRKRHSEVLSPTAFAFDPRRRDRPYIAFDFVVARWAAGSATHQGENVPLDALDALAGPAIPH